MGCVSRDSRIDRTLGHGLERSIARANLIPAGFSRGGGVRDHDRGGVRARHGAREDNGDKGY